MSKKRPNDVYSLEDQDKHWSTFDLGCSAAMVSAGFELISLDKENPRKVQFVFRWEDGINETSNEYWSNSLKVFGRTMFDNIKMLKNRIYSE